MTLLEKILRRQHSTNKCSTPSFKSYLSSSRNDEGRFVLEKNDVRLVIFKDHDRFGRKLLYDSLRCEGKDQNDRQLLGELMFGNQVLVKKVNSTIKVHVLKDPPQFLIAKVFISSNSSNSESDCQRISGLFDWYCFHDLPQNDLLASSMSLPVPLRDDLNKSYDASNVGSEPSYKASFSRWLATGNDDSSEVALTSSLAVPNTVNSTKGRQSLQGHDVTESCLAQSLPLNQRPAKLGIGILFQIPENEFSAEFMRKFFFSHVNILESFILKLKDILQHPEFLEKFKKCRHEHIHNFFQEMTEGVIQSLLSFYSSPRIQNPVWLTLSLPSVYSSPLCPSSSSSSSSLSSSPSSSFIAHEFMKEFVFLSEKCYTRNTKFFLGSLLTAVLTHHLSWATPFSSEPDELQTNSSANRSSRNPLLSQLRDLYGAVGFPCCISKTVVVGKRVDLVKKFLFILSYFIRCNDLLELSEPEEDSLRKDSAFSSFAAESNFSKDSGFSESEIDDGHSLRDKLKGLESVLQPISIDKLTNSNKFCSQHYQNEAVLVNSHKAEQSSESPSDHFNRSDDKLVRNKIHSTNEDFQSILPKPNKSRFPDSSVDVRGSTKHRRTCEVKEELLSVQREESQIQRRHCDASSVKKQIRILNGCSPGLDFDVEETLYEIMEEIFKQDVTSKEKHSISSLESVLSQLNTGDCQGDYSDCTLDVNEPTCLPEGPIKDQLLFKLDLIGTATTTDILSEPEMFASDTMMRNSIIKKLTTVPLLDAGDVDDVEQKLLLEDSNLGRSVLGGFCQSFTPEFVLHGTSDRSFLTPTYHSLHQDLKTSLKSSILSDPADAALYIVADTDTWSVQLFSLKSLSPEEPLSPQTIISSQLVLRLIESMFELSKFNSSPHIWLPHVENQLNNIFMKSKVLAEFIQIHGQFCSQQLARLLGYDVSDLPLLLAVAGIHSPKILPSLISPQRNF